jgi:hypothetical protein
MHIYNYMWEREYVLEQIALGLFKMKAVWGLFWAIKNGPMGIEAGIPLRHLPEFHGLLHCCSIYACPTLNHSCDSSRLCGPSPSSAWNSAWYTWTPVMGMSWCSHSMYPEFHVGTVLLVM